MLERRVIAVRAHKSGFEAIVELLKRLSTLRESKFLAFVDSRRMVELLVAATRRAEDPPRMEVTDEQDIAAEADLDVGAHAPGRVVPYRAGYEDEDRTRIESALREGTLGGVVSTSALELGLDIGDIDVVLLATLPPSAKAFWQRVGRAGRRRPSVCIVVDDRNVIAESFGGLEAYLARPLEPNWLYLENRYLQYAQALCAAAEIQSAPWFSRDKLRGLPADFDSFIQNELHPQEAIPADLYPLKQRTTGGRPQYEFPLRSNLERQFVVKDSSHRPLGSLTHAQAMREAYPGAIYYYMARPHRITAFRFFDGEIRAKRSPAYSTESIQQTMAFPRFPHGVHALQVGSGGFVAETELQVSERVLGFRELRGSARSEHKYGPTSEYSQRELTRFFETTGVCWAAPIDGLSSPRVTAAILEAFCLEFGIQPRDLGQGPFHSNRGPRGEDTVRGECIYDTTRGSLRLTQQLAQHFEEVLASALQIARTREMDDVSTVLQDLANWSAVTKPAEPLGAVAPLPTSDTGEWVIVIAPGQQAMFHAGDYSRTVSIEEIRYTPAGLRYRLDSADPDVSRWAEASTVSPVDGETQFVRYNLMTGEVEPMVG